MEFDRHNKIDIKRRQFDLNEIVQTAISKLRPNLSQLHPSPLDFSEIREFLKKRPIFRRRI
jgi:hypothetical protein